MAQARRPSRVKLLAIAVLAAVLAACGGEETDGPAQQLEPSATAAGCGPVRRYAEEGRSHLRGQQKGSYTTHPPQSGDHAGSWAPTGLHAEEVTDEAQVHNLEHGHVVIQYVPGKISAALLAELVALTKQNSRWILLAPRSAGRFDGGAVLAFTAWRILQPCNAPTAEAAGAARHFYEKYAKEAPEEIPGQPVSETPPAS